MEQNKSKENKKEKEASENGNIKKVIYILVVIIAIGGFVAYQFYNNSEQNELDSVLSDTAGPVAIVNGQEITRSELQNAKDQISAGQESDNSLPEASEDQLNSQALSSLVSRKLLEQRMETHNIQASQEDIDARIGELRSNFETEEEFQAQLESQGITEQQIIEQVRFELEMRQFMEKEFGAEVFDVTDEEIQQFYEQNIQGDENAPPLEEVRDQVEQLAVQEQQQQNLQDLLEQLRSEAEIEILI